MTTAPKNWKVTTVEEVCSFYSGGSPIESLEYSSTGIPVLAKGDVKPFGKLVHGNRYIPASIVDQKKFRKTTPGDILLTTRDLTQAADFLGLVAPIPSDQQYVINQGGNVIRLNDKIDEGFFVYWCNGPIYRKHIKTHYVGSTQIHLRKQDFLDAPLYLPPLSEQRAIAEVIHALENKIGLNHQMNRTLESFLKAVFRQEFVEGEDIEGWELGKLGDIAQNIRRSIHPEEIEPETPYIGLEHMPRGSISLSEWDNASAVVSNKFLFKQDEFLFGKLRPYFHKVGVAPLDGVSSTDILVVAPKDEDYYGVVLGHISSAELINYTAAASTGTKMPRTNWSDIARYEIALPPKDKAKEFSDFVKSVVQLIRSNIVQLRTLASLRDSLLPKLMRGEVRVKS